MYRRLSHGTLTGMPTLRTSLAILSLSVLAACSTNSGGVLDRSSGLTIKGTLQLKAENTLHDEAGCHGGGGYGDIAYGSAVTVTDEAGKIVGLSKLERGYESGQYLCEFAFTVTGVEAGHPFYGIEVAHRGVVKYAEADVTSPKLTLGS